MYGEGARRWIAWDALTRPTHTHSVCTMYAHNFRPMLFGIRYKPIMPWVNKEDTTMQMNAKAKMCPSELYFARKNPQQSEYVIASQINFVCLLLNLVQMSNFLCISILTILHRELARPKGTTVYPKESNVHRLLLGLSIAHESPQKVVLSPSSAGHLW